MGNSDAAEGEDWDEIHGFESLHEFERFVQWIASSKSDGTLVEVPVDTPYSGSPLFDERWFRARSGRLWRVVAPEPPFRGVFDRVPDA